ncbi:hypothetical protein D3C73_854500 [compost metagenome]
MSPFLYWLGINFTLSPLLAFSTSFPPSNIFATVNPPSPILIPSLSEISSSNKTSEFSTTLPTKTPVFLGYL